MNRREFMRRTLAVAASLGLPGGMAMAQPNAATFSLEGKSIYGYFMVTKTITRREFVEMYEEFVPHSDGNHVVVDRIEAASLI